MNRHLAILIFGISSGALLAQPTELAKQATGEVVEESEGIPDFRDSFFVRPDGDVYADRSGYEVVDGWTKIECKVNGPTVYAPRWLVDDEGYVKGYYLWRGLHSWARTVEYRWRADVEEWPSGFHGRKKLTRNSYSGIGRTYGTEGSLLGVSIPPTALNRSGLGCWIKLLRAEVQWGESWWWLDIASGEVHFSRPFNEPVTWASGWPRSSGPSVYVPSRMPSYQPSFTRPLPSSYLNRQGGYYPTGVYPVAPYRGTILYPRFR